MTSHPTQSTVEQRLAIAASLPGWTQAVLGLGVAEDELLTVAVDYDSAADKPALAIFDDKHRQAVVWLDREQAAGLVEAMRAMWSL